MAQHCESFLKSEDSLRDVGGQKPGVFRAVSSSIETARWSSSSRLASGTPH